MYLVLVLYVFFLYRFIKGICGFICEIIVGLIVNFVIWELRWKEYKERYLLFEYFRVFLIDDVEGIIFLFYEVMGDNFDFK